VSDSEIADIIFADNPFGAGPGTIDSRVTGSIDPGQFEDGPEVAE
jgi:hypothetical protein